MRFLTGDSTGLVKVIEGITVKQTFGSQSKGAGVAQLIFSGTRKNPEGEVTIAREGGLIEIHAALEFPEPDKVYSVTPTRVFKIPKETMVATEQLNAREKKDRVISFIGRVNDTDLLVVLSEGVCVLVKDFYKGN